MIPDSTTNLRNTIPSYLYSQYYADADLQSLVLAYNQAAQSYVDWFNDVNLPDYTGLSGDLLDWVGNGLYGVRRPVKTTVETPGTTGALATFKVAGMPLSSAGEATVTASQFVSDDIYRRVITWGFYKGDGFNFSIPWLKRRVCRFFLGTGDGFTPLVCVGFDDTTTPLPTCNIGWTGDAALLPEFESLIASGDLPLPYRFQYSISNTCPIYP